MPVRLASISARNRAISISPPRPDLGVPRFDIRLLRGLAAMVADRERESKSGLTPRVDIDNEKKTQLGLSNADIAEHAASAGRGTRGVATTYTHPDIGALA
jgi:hypothetical protein